LTLSVSAPPTRASKSFFCGTSSAATWPFLVRPRRAGRVAADDDDEGLVLTARREGGTR
jgi:hypothetical protein